MPKPKYEEWLEPDGLLKLKGWARQGLTDEEIAKNMGIARGTFYKWLNEFSDIKNTIKSGREPVIIKVEDTFIEKKLSGYFIEEEVMEKTVQRDAGGEIISTIEHKRVNKRYIPPDTTAMIFYLKCRRGEIYNDKLQVNVDTGRNGQLADLIEGLKNNVYTETAEIDEPMADE